MRLLGSFILIAFALFFFQNCQNQSQGEALYNTHCGSCHLSDGNGLGELIPSISESSLFTENRDILACQIRFGAGKTSEDGVDSYGMPPNESLSDIEITNILNYVRKNWHKDTKEFSLAEIKKSLEKCNQ